MNENENKKVNENGGAKKPVPKKKIIICAIIVAVIALVISIICIAIHNYKTVEPRELLTLQFTDMSVDDNQDIKLVAHRGHNTLAPENSLPAFDLAGQAGYWGCECDTYRTKDGVWVVSHDPSTFRLMNKSKKIEKSDYSELKELYFENGNNIETYNDTLGICTLEEYLEKCAQFNMKAFIELKGKNNRDHYNEIVELVEKYKVEAVYISYEKESLESMRKLTDSPMFYLSGTLSEDAIKTAKEIENCGIEFNANEKKNYANDSKLIKKALSEKLNVGCWGVDDLETMKKLVGLKVFYLTTDNITY